MKHILELLGLLCAHRNRSRVFGNTERGFYQICWHCLREIPATTNFPRGKMRSTLPALPRTCLTGLDRQWLSEHGIE